jgi:hypothetical protein
MKQISELKYGIISEQVNETDYLIGGDIVIPPAPRKFLDTSIEYKQDEINPYSCTIHGAIGAYSDLTGYLFTLEERKIIWQEAIKLGANPQLGWYINNAVDLVRNWINLNFNTKIISYRVTNNDYDFRSALANGYSIITGYRGNNNYNLDKNDGVLNQLNLTGDSTYGHCIRITQIDGEYVIDNYFGKVNRYKIEHFKELVDNKVFFIYGYFFIIQDENSIIKRKERRKNILEIVKSFIFKYKK